MSEQRVETDDVEHVAGLARVDLDEGDAERFVDQFADILEAFDALEDVPDVDRDVELTNVMRPDEERASLSQDDALANAPDSEDGYFKGPNVS
ncbi:Asp-tRNA(Asn)/Glu-tRNA(Gln) amidotransferase subunit GatC [Salinarchaeum laminariae]|uniref:Asp-tRNA(Asn)/Glu-tRNA(Gln) amidotransferase subunit GatC n=1 Tax=Salinarchaeum laminariae TaxID=869888 RepID=UPI0020BEF968|nr:Asp-tRNA(Asn)/Glu-tRNA(Gln) amidotransferase subunit GatC [Salinarchaeum laminariae]